MFQKNENKTNQVCFPYVPIFPFDSPDLFILIKVGDKFVSKAL